MLVKLSERRYLNLDDVSEVFYKDIVQVLVYRRGGYEFVPFLSAEEGAELLHAMHAQCCRSA